MLQPLSLQLTSEPKLCLLLWLFLFIRQMILWVYGLWQSQQEGTLAISTLSAAPTALVDNPLGLLTKEQSGDHNVWPYQPHFRVLS